jgi:hypothetical protein
MLANEASKPFTDVNWIFEAKWDELRAITYIHHKKLLTQFSVFIQKNRLTTIHGTMISDDPLSLLILENAKSGKRLFFAVFPGNVSASVAFSSLKTWLLSSQIASLLRASFCFVCAA